MAANKKLRITRRIVNSKRHTTGYVIGGKTCSVSQVKSLAEQGKVAGVRVVGQHIQATPGARKLSDLPMTVS